MKITYHKEFEQGSGEWLQARCGMLTSSDVDKIITPTLKVASNEKERGHTYELLAQRVNNYVEPSYISNDMLRGEQEEVLARKLYSEKVAPVEECGFVTNDRLGFPIGWSPDGLVGDDGQIEIKSRRQKYQTQTIVDGVVPAEYVLQVQFGLFVSNRKWCDFISYSNGMPMFVLRVMPDPLVFDAISGAARAFEDRLIEKMAAYRAACEKYILAPRLEYSEDIIT
jgi:predicted phage-related endonuclease